MFRHTVPIRHIIADTGRCPQRPYGLDMMPWNGKYRENPKNRGYRGSDEYCATLLCICHVAGTTPRSAWKCAPFFLTFSMMQGRCVCPAMKY